MLGEIKVLLDEDVHLALAGALRKRGYDAIHVREVKRLGLTDREQLEFAAREERCLVTFNVGEFAVWHSRYVTAQKEHFGIIVSPQKPIGRMLRELLLFLGSHSATEIAGQLFFLK
jgi:hypothetical protein